MSAPSTTDASAFHDGERAVQRLVGVEDVVGQVGQRFIRPHMPDQHRTFFEQLPFIVLGLVNDQGMPWAVIREGQPGFMASPDKKTLVINAPSLIEEALHIEAKAGDKIGLVGMELPTRRRNRMNGTIANVDDAGVTILVDQSFGNCDQYIQIREVEFDAARVAAQSSPVAANVTRTAILEDAEIEAIRKADTFYIASRSADMSDTRSDGVDVSHRGGKPRFIKITDGNKLIFPDFSGNKFFNTLGNIMVDNRVGLLFPDFNTGSTINIAGRAEIIWDGEALETFKGAERLVAVSVDEVVSTSGLLATRGALTVPSPELRRTGRWD